MVNMEFETWTPLHTRIIAHRIGDGTVNFYNRAVWDNKHTEEFENLCKLLGIKLWKPTVNKSKGTKKIIIPTLLYQNFGRLYNKDYIRLIKDPVYLVDSILSLPEAHRIQALMSIVLDDGSCVNWRMTVFEDTKEHLVQCVQTLWESLFPNTSKTGSIVTKHGTKVYHLYSNRDGIVQFYHKIQESIFEYGYIGSLWWKHSDLKNRYLKTISLKAKQLKETKESRPHWKKLVLDYLKKHQNITVKEACLFLGLTRWRVFRLLGKLVKERKIILIKAGNRSRYSLKMEDISEDGRQSKILNYLRLNSSISNKDARMLLDLKASKTFKILKKMVNKGLLEQMKRSNIKTFYALPLDKIG